MSNDRELQLIEYTAYALDELDQASRTRVEQLLTEDEEGRTHVQSIRQLARLIREKLPQQADDVAPLTPEEYLSKRQSAANPEVPTVVAQPTAKATAKAIPATTAETTQAENTANNKVSLMTWVLTAACAILLIALIHAKLSAPEPAAPTNNEELASTDATPVRWKKAYDLSAILGDLPTLSALEAKAQNSSWAKTLEAGVLTTTATTGTQPLDAQSLCPQNSSSSDYPLPAHSFTLTNPELTMAPIAELESRTARINAALKQIPLNVDSWKIESGQLIFEGAEEQHEHVTLTLEALSKSLPAPNTNELYQSLAMQIAGPQVAEQIHSQWQVAHQNTLAQAQTALVAVQQSQSLHRPFFNTLQQPQSATSIAGEPKAVQNLLNNRALAFGSAVRIEDLLTVIDHQPAVGAQKILSSEVCICPWNTSHYLVRFVANSSSELTQLELKVAFNPQQIGSYRLLGQEQTPQGTAKGNLGTLAANQSCVWWYELIPATQTNPTSRLKDSIAKLTAELEVARITRNNATDNASRDLAEIEYQGTLLRLKEMTAQIEQAQKDFSQAGPYLSYTLSSRADKLEWFSASLSSSETSETIGHDGLCVSTSDISPAAQVEVGAIALGLTLRNSPYAGSATLDMARQWLSTHDSIKGAKELLELATPVAPKADTPAKPDTQKFEPEIKAEIKSLTTPAAD